jgi:hypothetical protein
MLNRLLLTASVGTVLAVLPAAVSQASASGRYTKINVPGAAQTFPADINNLGVIDGFYFDASGKDHGYIDRGGRFTTLDYPRPGVSVTEADGINDFGVCVGLYVDAHGVAHGFLYRHGRFTAINDPEAATTPKGGTAAFSINDFGAIVGEYGDAHGVSHGFVYRDGKFTTIDDPHAPTAPGDVGTFAIGINNLGVIDGVYADSRGLPKLHRPGRQVHHDQRPARGHQVRAGHVRLDHQRPRSHHWPLHRRTWCLSRLRVPRRHFHHDQ